MDGYTYRNVKDSDIELICRFPQNKEELFFMHPNAVYPLTKQQLSEKIGQRHNSTVILYKDDVVAFANLYDIKQNESGFVGNVIVNPEYRRKGAGRFLISTMTHILASNYGVKEIHLSCFSENTASLFLYEKLGFIPYKMERRNNLQGNPFILFSLKKTIL